MYLHAGISRQSEQAEDCSSDCPPLVIGSSTLPRVPSRGGLVLELRMPFWLIPGDLIVLTPILALVSPSDLTRVAIRAASGGLIPWQRTFATPIGYFEFIVGRVVSATFYGVPERIWVPAVPSDAPTEMKSVGFRSVMLMFPVVEYSPFRIAAQTLIASLDVQLAYAIDLTFDTVVWDENGTRPGPGWSPAHVALIRLVLNGGHYL